MFQNRRTDNSKSYYTTKLKIAVNKLFAVFMVASLLIGFPAFARDLTPQEQAQLEAMNQENIAMKAQLDNLYAQERTLANEIAIADAQAAALQTQINNTQAQVNITNDQITSTANEIKAAEEELVKQKLNLNEYLKVMYIDGQTSQIELILTSENFSDFVDKSEYLNTMQNRIQETMSKIQSTKESLETKKKELESEKAKLDVLQESQTQQMAALNTQLYLKTSLISQNRAGQSSAEDIIQRNNANSYIIRCLASGACGSSGNGDLQIANISNPPNFSLYFQTDIPGTYDGSHSFAYWGCLITSLAMAHNQYPTTEAANHNYDSEGNMYGDSTSGSVISWSEANNRLANGQPVVMGLNIGHFVLAVGFANGKYLINDPYPGLSPNGYDLAQVTKLLRP